MLGTCVLGVYYRRKVLFFFLLSSSSSSSCDLRSPTTIAAFELGGSGSGRTTFILGPAGHKSGFAAAAGETHTWRRATD